MLAQMLILMLGFLLFGAYAALHSQQVRLGQMSLNPDISQPGCILRVKPRFCSMFAGVFELSAR